jgi:hypothetical protein
MVKKSTQEPFSFVILFHRQLLFALFSNPINHIFSSKLTMSNTSHQTVEYGQLFTQCKSEETQWCHPITHGVQTGQ